ncbi:unnamed protein product [Toxocara canis]|uniref:Secreted protein n=1 Tax=Toxocara canis TaxID=6265 RepID=A0A183V505_TOXCA|nr:unnamed protein product [Toxocara canis]
MSCRTITWLISGCAAVGLSKTDKPDKTIRITVHASSSYGGLFYVAQHFYGVAFFFECFHRKRHGAAAPRGMPLLMGQLGLSVFSYGD